MPPTPPEVRAEAAAIALDVLYEDASLLAINKPPGWSSIRRRDIGRERWSARCCIAGRRCRQASIPARLGIVHRLDKDTSGVLLIARTAAALAELGDQFRRREISKHYLALVWGAPRRRAG